jgi:photosystem II stability/assembly factor-like uncharacterized protein
MGNKNLKLTKIPIFQLNSSIQKQINHMRSIIVFLLLSNLTLSAQVLDFNTLSKLKIRNVGPANMSGRITAIDAVKSNPKIIFVGAASGGVWKSENGGSAWKPVFDNQPTQNIGAIAIQQSDPKVIWVGTGEGNPRNSVNLGMGIFKSEDSGHTWIHMGLKDTKSIHRIIIDPRNPNTIYVGAMGDPFSPDSSRGLYKTMDGGKHWKQVLFSNTSSGVADLVMHESNPDKLVVALYDHRRTPYSFVSGGKGSGIYITNNGGEQWEKLSDANGLPAGELGRVGLAIAPSNPNRMYAKVEAKKNALYRSDDGGMHWKMINDNPKFTNNRPFYFQDLAVDTKDPNRLYNIYQPLSVSYDGGVSFDPTPMIPADETKGIHADFHAMWIDPNDAQHFIIGGDGGLGITYDHGKSWYFPETIPVAQFYHVGVDNETPFNVYGGMQDNGNWSGPAYTWKRGGIRTLYWQYLVGGDGFHIAPDRDNARFGYGTSQNGDLYRYDKTTGYYQSISPIANDVSTHLRFNWNAGFAKDPFNESGAYYGSQFLHKTSDKGANWKIISPDLTTNNPEHQKPDYGGLTLDVSGAENYNSVISIAPSHLDKNVIWVGTDDGQVQLTDNAGATWTNVTKNITGLPNESWIARIHASRYEKGTAWVVANNYRKGDYAPYLFKTSDFGKTWTNIVDANRVKGYTLSFIQDPIEKKLVFMGTEHGLWVSMNEGKDWVQFTNGFPSVSTMDLVIQEKESALVVGTFGRSIWVLDDLKSLREIVAGKLKEKITALPMNEVVQVKGLFIAPPGNIWTGFGTTFEGENRAFQQATIPFYINEVPVKGDGVQAFIKNNVGDTIMKLNHGELSPGLNYIIWKLDEERVYLSGNYDSDDSRGIPVLPGIYTASIHYKGNESNTSVKVIADPRFDLKDEVDRELYRFQKAVNKEVGRLKSLFNVVDTLESQLKKIHERVNKQSKAASDLKAVNIVIDQVKQLKLKGRDRLAVRQVGAWQSNKITPYSAINAAEKASMARTHIPSDQDWKMLNDATMLIDLYQSAINKFESEQWRKFIKRF